ncbi:peptidase S41 [Bacteroidia bacterium]|nr:peptidase S41 [Bacteroidia bacterium]
MKRIRIIFSVLFIAFWGFPFSGRAQLTEKQRFEISKNLDIYNSLFSELNLHYVDTLNAEELIPKDIDYLLQRLDPYTEYIPKEEMTDFQFMTTGEYGGIGSIISLRNNKIIIAEPYEGMPAALAGLIPGDEILAIDGENMKDKAISYISGHLKGQPNTTFTLQYQRIGEKEPREVTLERKRIHINPVTYYTVLKNNIGYIYLSDFTTQSASAVKEALLALKNKGITSLILDVRNNGGGVVEDCLEMLNFFLPKGELLLTMKGRTPQTNHEYRAETAPVEPKLPLAILVNGHSASASEILSGTVQDADRGVIVGSRTYGKGLVQSSRPLPYDGKLKLTTARYYIPSGRSIQAIDYANRDEDGRAIAIPDSLTKEFYTKNYRPVRDGGGILPDFVVEEKTPTLLLYLEAKRMFFDFVSEWRATHPEIADAENLVITDTLYNEFKNFVNSHDFTYDRQSEKALESLKKVMEFENYYEAASEEFQALADKLKPDLNRDFELYKRQIFNHLGMQMAKQYYYHKGQLIYALRDDDVLNKAIEVLSDPATYKNTLTGKK